MNPVVRAELDRCRPWIEAALSRHGLERFEDVEAALDAGQAQLWPGRRSVMVTRVHPYASGASVIDSWVSGGEPNGSRDEIVNVLRPVIEAAATGWGCTHAMVEGGRYGWEKALKPYGYVSQGVILMKELR